jgi:hypothetical protein
MVIDKNIFDDDCVVLEGPPKKQVAKRRHQQVKRSLKIHDAGGRDAGGINEDKVENDFVDVVMVDSSSDEVVLIVYYIAMH